MNNLDRSVDILILLFVFGIIIYCLFHLIVDIIEFLIYRWAEKHQLETEEVKSTEL